MRERYIQYKLLHYLGGQTAQNVTQFPINTVLKEWDDDIDMVKRVLKQINPRVLVYSKGLLDNIGKNGKTFSNTELWGTLGPDWDKAYTKLKLEFEETSLPRPTKKKKKYSLPKWWNELSEGWKIFWAGAVLAVILAAVAIICS